MFRDTRKPRKHRERSEVKIGACGLPICQNAVDLVLVLHRAILFLFAREMRTRTSLPAKKIPSVYERRSEIWQTVIRACGHDPPWCNGSTTAFGAVRSRFESWGRSGAPVPRVGKA